MAKHNELGKRGEQIARTYLQENGYDILATNWKHRRSEIDIIASHNNALVFVEVKTRSHAFFQQPEAAVDEKKEDRIISTALAYLHQVDYDGEIRFDVISIVINNQDHVQLNHFEDAFFPGI